MFMSLIIGRCDVGLFKVKCFFQFKFTFSHVYMLISMYVILPNYWLYVVFSSFHFSFFIFLFHAVFVLRLWAMYAECLN